MNDNKPNNYNDSEDSAVKIWLEDNLRVLLSILIVIAIAGGIYSYSKRSQSPTVTNDTVKSSQEELLDKLVAEDKDAKDDKDDTVTTKTDEDEDTTISPSDTVAKEAPKQATTPTKEVSNSPTSTEISQETETSFIESAQKGEGATHLARRAVANYLEKNPDSNLTVEHKIYIEDYLRKNAKKSDSVAIGSSLEFQKDLIQSAIEKSKQLNEAQLKNLQKYSLQAPSLR